MQNSVATVAMTATMKASSVRWKLFLLMLLLFSVNYIDRASLSVAMPLIAKEFDLDPALQGLILSAFFWTYTLMQVPGGVLADRYKPRLVITAATMGWGLFQAIAAVSVSWWGLLLTRLGLGAFEAPLGPACGKLNAIWMTQNERGRGAVLFNSGAALGAALGAIIVAWLIALLDSWRLAFLIAGVGTVLCGWWSWHYIRNSPREHPSVNEAEALHIEEGHALEDSAAPDSSGEGWRAFFRYRSVWCMCFGWMAYNTVFYGLLTWLPNYLSKVNNLDIKTLGGASFLIFFTGFVGQITGGWIADFWRGKGGSFNAVYRTLFGISAAFVTVSLFLVAYARDLTTIVSLLCATMFFLTWCGMYWVIPSFLAGRERAGLLGGCMNLSGNIAGIVVPVIVGVIVQSTGSYFLALMFFAAAGLALFINSALIDYGRRLPV
ncbi:MFS transporter [Bradyrhizobium sp. NP1]|uniref:MFS transporter n=1 Tax=Bradyrhizobium sp. NP1 TaxID=3049772 RepID=UPI0025A4E31A|nr:MFS transporter [Bradyrhizobium sp. NP1]WJR76167.1 MFS transporter [Bradyrhizobium sp. NP1]